MSIVLVMLAIGGVEEILSISANPDLDSSKSSLIAMGFVIVVGIGIAAYYAWKEGGKAKSKR